MDPLSGCNYAFTQIRHAVPCDHLRQAAPQTQELRKSQMRLSAIIISAGMKTKFGPNRRVGRPRSGRRSHGRPQPRETGHGAARGISAFL